MELTGLNGQLFLVTGAAQGIGEAVARALASAGGKLALVDANGDGAATLAREFEARGITARSWAGDIANEESVERIVGEAEERMGAISGLVNVAGIQRLAPLIEHSLEDFQATLDVNLRGTFLVTRAVGKRMAAREGGAIVTISSNAARVPRVRQGSYCASKAGVSQLMRVFALELAPLGIRCNTVAPGSTETEMIRRLMDDMGFGEELLRGSLDNFRPGIPLGKNAQVEDVANAVLFLLSDQAGHVTMHEMVVDGGGTLGA